MRLAPSIFVLEAAPPLDAARVRLAFEEGTSVEPDIVTHSSVVSRVGPGRLAAAAGRRPLELLALDRQGETIATLRLDSDEFRR